MGAIWVHFLSKQDQEFQTLLSFPLSGVFKKSNLPHRLLLLFRFKFSILYSVLARSVHSLKFITAVSFEVVQGRSFKHSEVVIWILTLNFDSRIELSRRY